MDALVKFLKDNVKVAVTIVVMGIAVTVGYAKGCTVDVSPASDAVVETPVSP